MYQNGAWIRMEMGRNREARPKSQRYGGRSSRSHGGPIFNIPPVLWLIMGPSVGLFVVLQTALAGPKNGIMTELGLSPAILLNPALPLFNTEFFSLFTYMLVHGGWQHLIFNMLWLIVFGSLVARRLVAIGPLGARSSWRGYNRFLSFFAIAGVVAALGFSLLHRTSYTILVGASGAISAMIGAAMRFGLRRYQPHGPFSGELVRLNDKSFLSFSTFYILLNVLPLLGVALGDFLSSAGDGRIAWEAHIIGYVFGALFFPIVDKMAQQDRFAYIMVSSSEGAGDHFVSD